MGERGPENTTEYFTAHCPGRVHEGAAGTQASARAEGHHQGGGGSDRVAGLFPRVGRSGRQALSGNEDNATLLSRARAVDVRRRRPPAAGAVCTPGSALYKIHNTKVALLSNTSTWRRRRRRRGTREGRRLSGNMWRDTLSYQCARLLQPAWRRRREGGGAGAPRRSDPVPACPLVAAARTAAHAPPRLRTTTPRGASTHD